MPKTYTKDDVIAMLRKRLGERPIAALAKEFKVTPGYMGKMLKGLEVPGPAILRPLGFKS